MPKKRGFRAKDATDQRNKNRKVKKTTEQKQSKSAKALSSELAVYNCCGGLTAKSDVKKVLGNIFSSSVTIDKKSLKPRIPDALVLPHTGWKGARAEFDVEVAGQVDSDIVAEFPELTEEKVDEAVGVGFAFNKNLYDRIENAAYTGEEDLEQVAEARPNRPLNENENRALRGRVAVLKLRQKRIAGAPGRKIALIGVYAMQSKQSDQHFLLRELIKIVATRMKIARLLSTRGGGFELVSYFQHRMRRCQTTNRQKLARLFR